jgi:galactokinase
VNLIGEHVDYLGGLVLPAAVDRFTQVGGHPAPEWSIESDIQGGLKYVQAVGAELGAAPQAVHVTSEVPPAAGISSSAALLVAVAAGLRPDMDGKEAALACQRAEQRATGVQVGVMDQFASALGRRGSALLLDCGTLEYQVVPFPDEMAIAVIDSGEHRSLADTPYNQRRREAESGDPRRRKHVDSEDRPRARVRRRAEAATSHAWASCSTVAQEPSRRLRGVDAGGRRHRREGMGGRCCLGARIMGAGLVAASSPSSNAKTDRFRQSIDHPVLICATADGAFVKRTA